MLNDRKAEEPVCVLRFLSARVVGRCAGPGAEGGAPLRRGPITAPVALVLGAVVTATACSGLDAAPQAAVVSASTVPPDGVVDVFAKASQSADQDPEPQESPPGASGIGAQWSREEFEAWTQRMLGYDPLGAEEPGLTITLGAHVNRAVNIANDGASTDAFFVDSGHVPTLFEVKAVAPVSDDVTVSGQVAFSVQDNSASAVSQDTPSTGTTISGRQLEVVTASKSLGTLHFGKGFAASFLLAEIDKSGTFGANLLSPGNTAGGLKFVDSATQGLTAITVGEAFLDLEALNLINRVRYDLPPWAGFRIGGDVGQNDYADAALRWNHDTDRLETMLAGSYQHNPRGGRVDERVDGGLGLLHKGTGLNLTLGAARQSFIAGGPDSDGYIVRVGWRGPWLRGGETRTAIDYSHVDDITLPGDEGESIGLFVSHTLERWSLEPYLGFRWYGLDRPDVDLEDIQVLTIGVRMRFAAQLQEQR